MINRTGSAFAQQTMQESPPAQPAIRLRLERRAEDRVRSGHPWVYAEQIQSQNRDGTAGEIAVVYDRNNRFLAVGLFDPRSPIRVRVLANRKPTQIDTGFWRDRIQAAVALRLAKFSSREPDRLTDGYRVVNGESDGFPGLVLDRYAHILVAKVYTSAWRPWLTTVLDLTRHQLPGVTTIVQRSSRNLQIPEKGGAGGGVSDGTVLVGDAIEGDGRVVFHENGLKFETDPVRGQKTGFFLDQRENRKRVRALANGRDMLNVFSFSGAFSVYAAAGGARSVTDVDISRHALASAERNFRLNREIPAVAAAAAHREAVKADAFRWLEAAVDAPRRWGLVVIDPPSLAPRAADRDAGMRAYRRLLRAGLQLVKPGGDLVFASCSSQVRPDDFVALVDHELRAQDALDFHRTGVYGHAADHPATFPEAKYLKAVFLRRGAG